MVKFVIASVLMFLLVFFVLRITISLIIGHILNNSNIKKRKKSQTFIAWLFYTRFYDIIPLPFKVWYYGNAILCLLFVIAYIIIWLIGIEIEICRYLLLSHVIISDLPLIILYFLILDFNSPDKINISRLIKRGKNKKNK